MDGNGRWAERRGLPRTAGHNEGIEAIRRTVNSALQMNLRYLTVYSFSTENWSRPKSEVSFLLALLKRFIQVDVAKLHAQGVQVKVIGNRDDLASDILKLIVSAEELTADNEKLTLIVAFNYGGRQEMARALQRILVQSPNTELTPELIDQNLDTAGIPDPDLLIRTGGETRLSNFLLWQSAYTELLFLDVFWPDFDHEHFQKALESFYRRERRFGGLQAVAS